MPLQIKRGPTADRTSYTPLVGELVFDTDQNVLYVGDGAAAGGIASTSITIEDAQDAAANLLTSGSHSGITFTYNDTANRIDASIVGQLDVDISGSVFADDSSIMIDAVDNRIFAGGATITGRLSVTSNAVPDTDTVQLFSFTSSGTNTIGLSKARGTSGSPSVVNSSDTIYNFVFRGFDGSSFRDSSRIVSSVDGTVAAGAVPGRLLFLTSDSFGTMRPAMDINSSQEVRIRTSLNIENASQSFNNSQNGQTSRVVQFNRSRGTVVAPTTIVTGDHIYSLRFSGYDGTTNQISSQIRAEAEGTISTGIVPGRIRFLTADSAGTLTTALLIDREQTIQVNKKLVVSGTFKPPTLTQAQIDLIVPEVGMMVYNTTTGKFQGYAADANNDSTAGWADLH